MKRTLLGTLLILCALFISCDMGSADANDNEDRQLYEMNFRNGSYPTADYAGCIDTIIYSDQPDNNNGGDSYLTFLYNNTSTRRLLISFSLDDAIFPVGAQVERAYLYLYRTGSDSLVPIHLDVHELLTYWVEGTQSNALSTNGATWNNAVVGMKAWSTPGGDYAPRSVSVAQTSFQWGGFNSISLDPQLVQRWLESRNTNYGLLIKTQEETGLDVGCSIVSSESSVAYRPMLQIFYTIE